MYYRQFRVTLLSALLVVAIGLCTKRAVALDFPFGVYAVAGKNDFNPKKRNMQLVAERHFTSAGPYYTKDWRDFSTIYEAAESGLEYTYLLREHPSLDGLSGYDLNQAYLSLTNEQIALFIREQMEAIYADPIARETITRWSIQPEELRWWRPDELRYLQAARAAVQQIEIEHGAPHLPLWLYEPNSRTSESLQITGEYLDLVTRGLYNTTRYDRGPLRSGWTMWSIDQIVDASVQLGTTPQAVMQLFEDFTDPLTGTDPGEIRKVIRHDTYLALAKGIESLQLFSMHENRPNLTTHNDQFEAYGSVATDLNGELGLGRLFLESSELLGVSAEVVSGPTSFSYLHTDGQIFDYDTLTFFSGTVGLEDYLLLVNSTEGTLGVSITGVSPLSHVEELFGNTGWSQQSTGQIDVSIEGLGVYAFKFSNLTLAPLTILPEPSAMQISAAVLLAMGMLVARRHLR